MAFVPFVALRVFSSYTMLDGAIEPKAIAQVARERGFPAIAVCDRNGLYSVPPFAAACRDKGIQPIIGALLGVARESPQDGAVRSASEFSGWRSPIESTACSRSSTSAAAASCTGQLRQWM